MKLSIFNIALLFFLAPAAAQAADSLPFFNLSAQYEFTYTGILIGNMGFESEQAAPARYTITSDIVSAGVLSFFVKHSSHTTTVAAGKNDIVYESHYHTKNKPRSIKLVYKNGVVTERDVVPPEDPAKRPPVPTETSKDSVDPLTFIVLLRQKLFDTLQSGQKDYSINVYDTKRLTQANFHIVGKTTMTYNGQETPVIAVSATRTPLAGFQQKELDEAKDDPPLTIYFSDDGRLIPIRMQLDLTIGYLDATLDKECAKGESCLLGNKD